MIIIKELLPNPVGKDTAGEWISLLNNGEEAISLQGWSIKDTSDKTFRFSNQTISPNQEIQLGYQATRINLNNDGDTITLYDSSGKEVDELSYGQVGEEEIVVSAKVAPPAEAEQLVASPLAAQEFVGSKISSEALSPLLIALGLALAFGIGAAILTKKLINPD